MTMWEPDLAGRRGPRYRVIADALADDVGHGALAPGMRLPTHRDLARTLGVTVGTVSRAYAEAERRGLVKGQVGRGTFVRSAAPEPVRFGEPQSEDPAVIDLGSSMPAIPVHDDERRTLAQAFEALARRDDLPALLDSQPHAGALNHRAAAARWLRRSGLAVDAQQVLICCGAQHAMAVTFSSLTKPGDVVMTEELTFPGMKGLANLLHFRLQGLPMDRMGLRPDAFESACQLGESKVLYTVPTLHNPTATVMPEKRRHELAEIAGEHEVAIVEDDVYGFLAGERPPPLASLAPETSYYINSISKMVAPGFRIGFLAAPRGMIERLGAAVWASAWMAAPPMAELACGWLEDGTIDRFAEWKRREAAARNEIAQRILGQARFNWQPHGYFIWLQLPEPWRSEDFVRQAAHRGVKVSSTEVFVAGRASAPHAVRISLAVQRDRGRLETGLQILAEILAAPPEPCVSVP